MIVSRVQAAPAPASCQAYGSHARLSSIHQPDERCYFSLQTSCPWASVVIDSTITVPALLSAVLRKPWQETPSSLVTLLAARPSGASGGWDPVSLAALWRVQPGLTAPRPAWPRRRLQQRGTRIGKLP